jgi:hypothetical protein
MPSYVASAGCFLDSPFIFSVLIGLAVPRLLRQQLTAKNYLSLKMVTMILRVFNLENYHFPAYLPRIICYLLESTTIE